MAVLAAFAESYRFEVAAEEDVYRTLPFFGTALGIIIAAIAYAAGRLTRWDDIPSHTLFLASTTLLALAAAAAIGVIIRLSQALAPQDYQRVGPEEYLTTRLGDLKTYYASLPTLPDNYDESLANDFRQVLIDSYHSVIPRNRKLNLLRYRRRSQAASYLVRSLLLALAATILIFASDKIGLLPRTTP